MEESCGEKLKVNFTLEYAVKTQRGSKVIAIFYILSLTSVYDVGGCSTPTPAALPPGKRHSTHCTGVWWVPEPVLDG